MERAAQTVPLLSVRDLVTRFRIGRGTVTAVDHVSFDVGAEKPWRSSASRVRARA